MKHFILLSLTAFVGTRFANAAGSSFQPGPIMHVGAGGESSDSRFKIIGSIGQADIGTRTDLAGNHRFAAGFWQPAGTVAPACIILTCPANITVSTLNPAGLVVNYPSPVASDNCGIPTVSCSPPSGSFIPPGTTIINCTASDAAANIASCSFAVTVIGGLLPCEPMIAHAAPGAPAQPAHIKGRVQFLNNNPEVLSRLGVAVPSESLVAVFEAASSTARTDARVPRPAGPPSFDYDLVVQAPPIEVPEGSPFLVKANVLLPQQYVLLGKTTPPMHEGDVATVNFCECAALLNLRFVDRPGGSPVSVGNARIFVSAHDPSLPGDGYYLQAVTYGASGTGHQMIVDAADAYRVLLDYSQGINPEVDLVYYPPITINITTPLACDGVVTHEVVLPLPPATGHVRGRVNLVAPDGGEGPVEIPGGSLENVYDLLTAIVADAPPHEGGGGVTVLDRFDWLDQTPSSGKFDLPNLLSSAAVGPYRFWSRMQFRTDHGREFFRTPSLITAPNVPAAGLVDLGDTFVIRTGHVSGRVLLQGPMESGSYRSPLRQLGRLPASFGAWQLSGFSSIEARGVNRLAAGATESAVDGLAVVEFDGALNGSGAFEGRYQMAVGGLKSQPSIWAVSKLNLLLDSSHGADPFVLGKLDLVDRRPAAVTEATVAPGAQVTRDVGCCFSEVVLQLDAPPGTRLFDPRVSVEGEFVGRDFQGIDANYSVATGRANVGGYYLGTDTLLPFLGEPRTRETATNTAIVRLFLPQGVYHRVVPQFSTLSADGATNLVTLPPLTGGLIVGCGQRCTFPVIVSPDCATNCIAITCPKDIRLPCASLNGTPVEYAVMATNHCDPGDLVIRCTPPSGSYFQPGITPVYCEAIGRGQTNGCHFTVEILRILPLRIVPFGPDQFRIAWTRSCQEPVVEQTPSFGPQRVWHRVPDAVQSIGEEEFVIVPRNLGDPAMFFRLRSADPGAEGRALD